MHFEAIQRSSAPDKVAEQLLARIKSGELAPGTRLPPQRELARQFGVGRSSVREALNALAVMGFLEVFQGKGTFVAREIPGSDPTAAALRAAFQAESLLDLLELREALECRAAELAAERIESGQLAGLRRCLQALEHAGDDYPAFLAADFEFHRRLCEASGNRAFAEIVNPLLSRVAEEHERLKTGLLSRGYREHSVRTLKQLIACLEREDGRGAREWMRDHLNAIRSELKDVL